jgi:hypothetical protein
MHFAPLQLRWHQITTLRAGGGILRAPSADSAAVCLLRGSYFGIIIDRSWPRVCENPNHLPCRFDSARFESTKSREIEPTCPKMHCTISASIVITRPRPFAAIGANRRLRRLAQTELANSLVSYVSGVPRAEVLLRGTGSAGLVGCMRTSLRSPSRLQKKKP